MNITNIKKAQDLINEVHKSIVWSVTSERRTEEQQVKALSLAFLLLDTEITKEEASVPKEQFKHDVCPECGQPSTPAEGVLDQALRSCLCGNTWLENLEQPVRTEPIVNVREQMLDTGWERTALGNWIDPVTGGVVSFDQARSMFLARITDDKEEQE